MEWQGEYNSISHTESQFKILKEKYSAEMAEFSKRIKDHPTVKQIGVKRSAEDYQQANPEIGADDV